MGTKLSTVFGVLLAMAPLSQAHADAKALRAAIDRATEQVMTDGSAPAADIKQNGTDLRVALDQQGGAAAVYLEGATNVAYHYSGAQLQNVPAASVGSTHPEQMNKWAVMAIASLTEQNPNGLAKSASVFSLKLMNAMASITFADTAGKSKRYMCHNMGGEDMCM